jgi:uncharacterized protein (TIGR03790 family)
MQSLPRWAAVVLVTLVAPAAPLLAGGGPENLLLVVNQNSDDSKTIANHYIRLRDIPPTNVLYLDWKGDAITTSSEQFREEILKPIVSTIDSRKLAAQIEYVVYSAGFPFRIKFTEEFKDEKLAKQFLPIASLTGATYLWTYSMTANPAMVMPTVNWYVPASARRNQVACQDCSMAPTRGFRAGRYWTKEGQPTTERGKGQSYLISTMLGVTVDRGNTVDEVVNYLTRASVADNSHPDGTFYFMKNDNVRSTARHDCYPAVARKLQAEGAKVALADGKIPIEADNALGIMTGTANFDVGDSGISIVPGAICDHLTSSGGAFDDRSQTKLAAWLRRGAAGASGTVAEPYAIQAKFPLPSMHLHYRRGASLGEAFYQSISGPYQLLVVGDPLCQPWAKPPKVEIEGVEPGQVVSGPVTIKAKVDPLIGTQAKSCELYIDGRLVARYPYTLPVPLDTSKLAAGRHEFRLVAATADAIEFRGRAIVPVTVAQQDNESREVQITDADVPTPTPVSIDVSPKPMVAAGATITVTVAGPDDAAGIDILQNHRRVGRVEGGSGSVAIDTRVLGRGPVALVAQVASGGSSEAPALPVEASRSAPFWLLVR